MLYSVSSIFFFAGCKNVEIKSLVIKAINYRRLGSSYKVMKLTTNTKLSTLQIPL